MKRIKNRTPEEKAIYNRGYTAGRKAANKAWARYFLGGKCAKCPDEGYDLEFDHIDPTTKRKCVSNMLTWQFEKLLNELKKCQLLCPPCHEQKGQEDLSSEPPF